MGPLRKQLQGGEDGHDGPVLWILRGRYTRAARLDERASMRVSRLESSVFVTILPVWPMADMIASARGRSAPAASRARVALEMSKGGEVMARPAW